MVPRMLLRGVYCAENALIGVSASSKPFALKHAGQARWSGIKCLYARDHNRAASASYELALLLLEQPSIGLQGQARHDSLHDDHMYYASAAQAMHMWLRRWRGGVPPPCGSLGPAAGRP